MTVKAKLVQGGDGTAIPSGMVGEQYVFITKNSSNLTSGNFFDALSAAFNLPLGVWEIQSNISIVSTGSPTSVRLKNYGVCTVAGNVVTGYAGEEYAGDITATAGYTSGIRTLCNHRLTVTNASQNYYLKGYYSAAGTPGTATIDVVILRAIRIA